MKFLFQKYCFYKFCGWSLGGLLLTLYTIVSLYSVNTRLSRLLTGSSAAVIRDCFSLPETEIITQWRHDMATVSALLALCDGNHWSHVIPSERASNSERHVSWDDIMRNDLLIAPWTKMVDSQQTRTTSEWCQNFCSKLINQFLFRWWIGAE